VGGADKTVSVIDTRKWNTLAQWKKVVHAASTTVATAALFHLAVRLLIRTLYVQVMKYEILSLHFSGLDNSFLYVAGLDHEVGRLYRWTL